MPQRSGDHFSCALKVRSTEERQLAAVVVARSQLASVAEQVAEMLPNPALTVPLTEMVQVKGVTGRAEGLDL